MHVFNDSATFKSIFLVVQVCDLLMCDMDMEYVCFYISPDKDHR